MRIKVLRFDNYIFKVAMAIGCMFVLCVGASGCSEDSDVYLEGSVTDSYNMDFDSSRIRLYPESALSIEYVKQGETGEQIPLRVTIDRPELQLAAGGEYNISTEGTIGRSVGYDNSPLPALASGTIRLSSFSGEAGSSVEGDFEAVFTAENGSKINLRGGFSGSLERVE